MMASYFYFDAVCGSAGFSYLWDYMRHICALLLDSSLFQFSPTELIYNLFPFGQYNLVDALRCYSPEQLEDAF